MSKKSMYKKIKGTSRLGSNALYRGDNHLLSCNSTSFSEEYLRFYYKDIQSIITRKTSTGKIINICLILALILFLFPAFFSPGAWGVVLSSIIFIFLVINVLSGPTAVCYIQTLVQTAKLSSVKRVKSAEKVLSQVKPLIENSQGTVSEDFIKKSKQDEPSESSDFVPGVTGVIDKHEDGRFHQVLFAVLAASSVFLILDIFYPGTFMALLSGIANLTIGTLLVLSLRKQFKSDLFKSVKVLSWTVAGYLGLRYVFSYMLYMYVSLSNPKLAYLQWELFKSSAAISVKEHTWMMAVYSLFIAYTIGVGVTGIILLAMFRKEYNRQSEAALNRSDMSDEGHE